MDRDLAELLAPSDTFEARHLGPRPEELEQMLRVVGYESLDQLSQAAVPASIQSGRALAIGPGRGEHETLAELAAMARENRVLRSFIGCGYYGTITPPVILRNVLENPGYYTQYTPYQAEISQGRLEALLNFQTLVSDLTGLPLSNASLLDEATAAAEAMTLCLRQSKQQRAVFFAAADCHPQTLAVVRGRAEPLGIEVFVGDPAELDFDRTPAFAVLVQYPTTDGRVLDYSQLADRAHRAGAALIVATDLLALTLLRPPGEFGADVAIGSTQRFGVPMGFGGPHAAFMATRADYTRQLPGRIVGVSRDNSGKRAYRLAIQTREQHIRRDRATSNICTAQVLLAIMASMYAVYHGPKGLQRIARRVRGYTYALRAGLTRLGYDTGKTPVFDTLRVALGKQEQARILDAARARGINLRSYDDGAIGISFDETTTAQHLNDVLAAFSRDTLPFAPADVLPAAREQAAGALERTSGYLTHAVFNSYHSETELLRYINRLQARDLSLTTSMIPLGSCTMKLNATSEMLPVTWREFSDLHPFAPADQSAGYAKMFGQLESWLADVTGMSAVSLQPNSGAQGEYAGLLVLRAYFAERGESHRNVCLIPVSAHGTNPASAVMAGFRVVVVACDERGNVNLDDLRAKAQAHQRELGALMLTYPSTHGVFETKVREICEIVHEHGGQVYLDGANMNAQVGLCRPGDYGADVCHLNLHKTFCIPHGGGGPGMGPIAVAEHLKPFLPGHPVSVPATKAISPVSAAPFGSPGILCIPWMYIRMMGSEGLKRATQVALLNANYMMKRLAGHYPVLYSGERGLCAHEFIIDARPFKKSAGIEVEDIAKRLMDYGFHAPTMSFPVPGTLMIEPTESESKPELDRLCDALIAIRQEIRAIESGTMDASNNPLKNAPHTAQATLDGEWHRPYSRAQGAFPAPWTREHKYWPPVGRIDNAAGDRNLVCVCPPMDAYS